MSQSPRVFTPDQQVALTALYAQEDKWWHYFYILSDDVQFEVGEEAANGMRWLCQVRQRPWSAKSSERLVRPWQWWTVVSVVEYVNAAIKQKEYGYTECNYLPVEFSSICLNCHLDRRPPPPVDNLFPSSYTFVGPVDGLEAFLRRWCELTDGERERVWKAIGSLEAGRSE